MSFPMCRNFLDKEFKIPIRLLIIIRGKGNHFTPTRWALSAREGSNTPSPPQKMDSGCIRTAMGPYKASLSPQPTSQRTLCCQISSSDAPTQTPAGGITHARAVTTQTRVCACSVPRDDTIFWASVSSAQEELLCLSSSGSW